MSVIGFLATIVIVTGLIHLYLWKRLVRDTTRRGRWRRVGTVAIITLAVLVPAAQASSRSGIHLLAWPGYLWLALMFYLLVILVVLEIPMLVARLALRRRTASAPPAPVDAATAPESATIIEPALVGGRAPAEPPAPPAPPAPSTPSLDHDPNRRLLLARGAAIFAGLTAVGVTGYGMTTALGAPRIDRVSIPLARLPRGLDGLRIATVSDIHIGPLLGRAHTQRIVDMINGLDADLVAVVGDLVDDTVAELGSAAAPLADLRSRYGSFFVTGNHEYYSGVEEWVVEIDRLGLNVLQNERREIVTPRGVLDLAGVNDPAGEGLGFAGGPDFDKALGDRDPSRPVVLLAHQPIVAAEAAKHGVDLQLSGHTHGGQMVPFNLLVGLAQPVVSGRGNVDGTEVYVTNGAGFWGPPVRVGAPPQISLVELRAP